MHKATDITLIPHISEKTYALSEEKNTYVFDVPQTVNKEQIASAVEEQFDVTVKKVNVIRAKGKAKKSYRKRGNFVIGQRKTIKKAYVTLKEGDNIAFFEEGGK